MIEYLNDPKNWSLCSENPLDLIKAKKNYIVYKLLDSEQNVVYVGETRNGARRMWQHDAEDNYEFSDIEFIMTNARTATENKVIESYIIDMHWPIKYNSKRGIRGYYLTDSTLEKFLI